ncbi:MAG: caspase family protein [Anaerolineae bacterium]|nr:caspase family protein [Anaerolineae bacterium]
MAPSSITTTGGVRRSLHIAVDKYRHAGPFLPNLAGCENDIRAMRQLLTSRFGFEERNAVLLINEQATRQAITAAWHGLTEQTQAGDTVFIQYSGHGSQMRDVHGDEEDGMDETILPHDTRDPGRQVFDITDDEIKEWVDALLAKTDNVVLLFDCCHSASATRQVGAPTVPTRRADPDPRDPPPAAAGARSVDVVEHGPSGWFPPNERLVFMAGCRDNEESNEHRAPEGGRYGALTYFLMQSMQSAAADATFRDVFESVTAEVSSRYRQNPQIEGALDRPLFAREFSGQQPFFYVNRVDAANRLVEIGAGAAHGMRTGSQIALFRPRTRRFDKDSNRLATATIVQVGGISSQAWLPDDVDPNSVPLRARSVELVRNSGDQRLRVALTAEAGQEAVLAGLQDALPASGRLRITDEGEGAGTDAQVLVQAQAISLIFPDGRLMMQPVPAQAPNLESDVQSRLEAVARFQNVLHIENPNSGLVNALEIRFERQAAAGANSGQTLAPQQGGQLVVREREPYLMRFTNRGATTVYVTVLALSADWRIHKLYPVLENDFPPLAPGKSHALRFDEGSLMTELPYVANEATDFFKFFVTSQPTDFSVLTQAASRDPDLDHASSLQRLLWQAAVKPGSKSATSVYAQAADDWATVTAGLTVRREGAAGLPATTLAPGFSSALLRGTGVVLRKAPDVSATLNPGEWRPGLGAGETALPPPNLLADLPGIEPYRFAPPPGAARRSAGAAQGAAYVDLAAQGGALSFDVPVEEGTQAIIAIATDGMAYYPVGQMGATPDAMEDMPGLVGVRAGTRGVGLPMQSLQIDWLPPSPTTRGVGRTLRLYLYKISGQEIPDIGLRHAQVNAAGEVEYTPIKDGDLEGVSKVALFVHGFTSDSRWMVQGPAQWLNSEGLDYRIITFDYETFNTSVSDNAKTLQQALVKAGFRPEDGRQLDLYVHSLGSLVSRTMIEKWGGAAFVDRLVMAGPPNAGTPLVKYGKQAITWLGSVLLNSAAPTVPALIGSWFLKQALQRAISTGDMEPDSPLLSEINGLTQPDHVPYLVLAGRNEERPVSPNATWKQIALKTLGDVVDLGLDVLFQGQNDLAVGVKSARGVRGGDYPALRVVEMTCNHFGYFGSPQGQEAILRWLAP